MKKIRVTGKLPNEKEETILGYVDSFEEADDIHEEYATVFSEITFRDKAVTMISAEKGKMLNALIGALTPFGLTNTNKIR